MTRNEKRDPVRLPQVKRAYTDEEIDSLPPELRDWLAWTPDGCLVWIGRRHKTGYGLVSRQVPGLDERVTTAHGAVWRLLRGQVPEGKSIGHSCHDRATALGECKGGPRCVHRPCVVHIELQAADENRGKTFPAVRTHCKRGHELVGDNLKLVKGRKPGQTYRQCVTCNREWRRRRNAKTSKRYREDPEYRAEVNRRSNERLKRKRREDPEFREQLNAQQRQRYAEDHERAREYAREWRLKHLESERERNRVHDEKPEVRERKNEYRRKRYREDPDYRKRVREKQRAQYHEDPERHRAQAREYYHAHKQRTELSEGPED